MKYMFLIFSLFLVPFLSYAESNGLWIPAEDVRGGILGFDETTNDFGVSGTLNVSEVLSALGGAYVNGTLYINNISTDSLYVNEGQLNSIISSMIVDGSVKFIDVDSNEIQARVSGVCPIGSSIRVITASGLVACETDDAADADADPTNEFQNLSFVGNTLSISNGNSVILPVDGDSDPTNELQGILSNQGLRISGNDFGLINTCLDDQVLRWDSTLNVWHCSADLTIDGDANPTNELQAISIAGNVVSLTNGGGSITLPVDNVNDADADPTNELQAISIAGNVVSLTNGGGSITLPADNVNDSDADSTNEIQTLTIAGDVISLTGGGSVNLPFDDVNDSDSDPTNELQGVLSNQGLRLSGNQFGLTNVCPLNQILKWSGAQWFCTNDLTIDGDANPTNEIQTLSIAGNTISLTGGGSVILPADNVNDADADPTNEIQGVLNNQGIRVSGDDFGLINTCGVNQVLKWNGGSWTCRNDLTIDGDANPTNEIQTLSIVGNTISLTGGGSVILPVDNVNDADIDPTNEIQGVLANQGLRVFGNAFGLVGSCGVGQFLKFDGTNWNCVNISATPPVTTGCEDYGEFVMGWNSTGNPVCAKPVAECVDVTWGPDASGVCSGDTFVQTSNCGTIQNETGIKTCGVSAPVPPGSCGETTIDSSIFNYWEDDFTSGGTELSTRILSIAGCTSGAIPLGNVNDIFNYSCSSIETSTVNEDLLAQTSFETFSTDSGNVILTCNSDGDWEYDCSSSYDILRGTSYSCIASSTPPFTGVCTDSSWAPTVSQMCNGTSFTQTSNCGTSRIEVGTRFCPMGGGASGSDWNGNYWKLR